MKRILQWCSFYVMAMCMTFLCACAGEPKIVDETTFVSSNPKLQVSVIDVYRYVGKAHISTSRPKTGTLALAENTHAYGDAYIFLPQTQNNDQMNIGIYVTISTTQPKWKFVHPFRDLDAKYILHHGTKELGGESYQYITCLLCFNPQDSIAQFVKQSGMSLPKYCLEFTLKRLVDDTTVESITYFEDISPTGYDRQHWSDRRKLSSDQKNYIAAFEQRALSSFQVTRP